MADNVSEVLILGHLFVRRPRGDVRLPRPSFNHQFQPFGYPLVFLFGVGGLTVSKLQSLDLHVVRRLLPDVIILKIGTHDLSFMRLKLLDPQYRI